MTTRFRLDAVELNTTEGLVHYEFQSDLTVLAGKTGVGKTTLLEMIKYGFGGDGHLAPVARQYVNDITLDVSIANSRLRITRSVDREKSGFARVTDLVTRETLPDHLVESEQRDRRLASRLPNLNKLLLTALGLPANTRAAARTGSSSNVGARITFNDVFSFLYVAQYNINRDIAHSQDNYREPKRKAVFELLFGLTNSEILAMRSEVNRLNGEISQAERELATVLAFLRDSRTTDRFEAEKSVHSAVTVQAGAEADLSELRNAIDPVTDRETQVLRDLLSEAERGLAEARTAVIDLVRQQADLTSERRRVQADLARLHRMRDADARLANIEFAVCPRCLQSLTQRPTPAGACRVCLQQDQVTSAAAADQYELRQLSDQLTEMDDQLDAIVGLLRRTTEAVSDRDELVASLSAKVEARTAERITPRLQAFSDAADRLANARSQQRQFEIVLRQWDRVDDLAAAISELDANRQRLRQEMDESESNLRERRNTILSELNDEFQSTVALLGIPGVETASIHPTTYLPLLNGQPFATFSQGGGIVTATQIGYWTSLLTVALRRGDTYYPAFLLIDSPRLALNTAENLSAALYRRMVAQADAGRGRLQLIVADNEVPAAYRRDYAEIEFTYDRPTVRTVRHPGPDAVQLITAFAADDDA